MTVARNLFLVAILTIVSSSLHAAEIWDCTYSSYRNSEASEQASFRVEGNHLIENSGDVIVEYQLLENSKTAIVAAKGGSYASEPYLMGFLLMIEKVNGEFVLTTASTDDANTQQTGKCLKRSN